MVELTKNIKDVEPRPLRPNTDWVASEFITNKCELEAGTNILTKSGKITCRTCEGFGHS